MRAGKRLIGSTVLMGKYESGGYDELGYWVVRGVGCEGEMSEPDGFLDGMGPR